MILFGKKRKIQIRKHLKSEARDAITDNPDRGFYHVYPFYLSEEKDNETLGSGFYHDETLALIEICLCDYAGGDLTDEALRCADNILRFFINEGFDIILRVSYDLDGLCASKEPSNVNQIMRHMDSLCTVFNVHAAHIPVFQGIFIGNWGEMHGSRYTAPSYMGRLYRHLRDALSDDIVIAFRRPTFKRHFSEEKIALFNDAIMASESDMGTYADGTREAELSYQEEEVSGLFNGGEALYPGSTLTSEYIAKTLRRMHICYLNSAYDARVLDLWKRIDAPDISKCIPKHLTDGIELSYRQSLFEFVKAMLGYRLIVTNLEKKAEELVIHIVNMGFGAVFRDTTLVLNIGRYNASYDVASDTFLPGQKSTFAFPTENIPEGTYKLILSLKRKSDGRNICFANEGASHNGLEVGVIKIT